MLASFCHSHKSFSPRVQRLLGNYRTGAQQSRAEPFEMTRIGSIFALVLVALLASFALVDAGLPPRSRAAGASSRRPRWTRRWCCRRIVEAPRSHERDPVDRPSATPRRRGEGADRRVRRRRGLHAPRRVHPDAARARRRRRTDPPMAPDDDDDGADPKTAATPACPRVRTIPPARRTRTRTTMRTTRNANAGDDRRGGRARCR